MSLYLFSIFTAMFLISIHAFATPSGLTLQGRLVKDDVPVSGAVVARVSIMSPNTDRCYLYEELHSFTLSNTDAGVFSVQIGAGSRTTNDRGFSLVQVFSNTNVLIGGLTCLGNSGTPTTYTPVPGHSRHIYLSFSTPQGAVAFNDPYVVQSVPYALEAEKLAGKSAAQFLQTTADTTQNKLNDLMNPTRYSDMMSLISGDSTKYMSTSDNAPTKLPVLSSTPGSPTVGQIWYEGGDIRYYDANSLTIKTLGTSSGITGMSGDVSSTGVGTVTTTIGNDVVTFAKMQNISDDRILGRNAGSAGDIQEIQIGTGLTLSGGVLSNSVSAPGNASYTGKGVVQFDSNAATSGIAVSSGVAKLADSGVTAGSYGTASRVPQIQVDAFGRITTATSVDISVGTANIVNDSITYAKIQNVTDDRILGRNAGSAGDVQEIQIGTGLTLSGGVLSNSVSAAGNASYTDKGVVQFDTNALTSGISVSSGVAKLATSGVAVGSYGTSTKIPQVQVDAFGRITSATSVDISVGTANIADDSITYAKIQNVTDDRILGRNAGSAGDVQEIRIGSGLTFSGGILSNTLTPASYSERGVVQFDTDAATSGISINLGTAKLANSGVTAGSYGTATKIPQIQIDAFGRITNATSVDVTLSASAITSGVVPIAHGGTGTNALTANRIVMVSGDGTALRTDTCGSDQVLQFNGSIWVCVAATSLGQGGDIKNGGNTGAVVIGTDDSNKLSFETNNITAMTISAGSAGVGGNVGIGTVNPTHPLNVITGIALDRFGGSSPHLVMRGAGGTLGSQTATTGGSGVGKISGNSYDGTDWHTNSSIEFMATQNQTASNRGAKIVFGTTANNTAATVDRMTIDHSGNIGVGVSSPTARLHLAAGSSGDGTAPLRLTSSGSGVLLANPADGAMEYDGTKLWFTIGATRREIATTASSGSFSDVTNISNSSGSITMIPSSGNSVVINQNTSSVSPATGALIVNGGVGVDGAIHSGGGITSGGFVSSKSISSGAALIADSGAGTYREVRLQTSGALRWDLYADTSAESGSNAGSNFYISRYADDGNYLDTAMTIFRNNGNVAIAPNAGNVGIGTASPSSKLHVQSNTGAYFNLDSSTATSADGSAVMVLTNNSGKKADIGILRSGLTAPYPDNLLIRTQTAGSDILFSPGSVTTPTIAFKSGGYVGIGTMAPLSPLHIVNNPGNTHGNVRIEGTTHPSISFVNTGTQAYAQYVDTADANKFKIDNSNAGIPGTNLLTITSDGKVGIGLSSPQKKLDVRGPINDFVTVGAATMAVGDWTGIHFGYREDNNSYRKSAIVFERTDDSGGGGNAAGKIHILNGSEVGADSANLTHARLTVGERGNVGVGERNPAAKLDVAGQIRPTMGTPTTDSAGVSVDFVSGNTQMATFTSCPGNTLTVNLYSMLEGGSYSLILTTPTGCVVSFTATTAAYGAGGGTAAGSFKFSGGYVFPSTAEPSVYSFLRGNNIVFSSQVTDFR